MKRWKLEEMINEIILTENERYEDLCSKLKGIEEYLGIEEDYDSMKVKYIKREKR
jgi:hypothetical protein